jgi:hypothetical protein
MLTSVVSGDVGFSILFDPLRSDLMGSRPRCCMILAIDDSIALLISLRRVMNEESAYSHSCKRRDVPL